MGFSDLIPGVSGGTIAFITGIYKELINTLVGLNFSKLKLIRNKNFNSFWISINGNFIFSLSLGIISSILIFSRLIEYLLKNFSIEIWSFFFGLILSSVIYFLKKYSLFGKLNFILILLGAIFSYFLTLVSPSEKEITLIYLFFSSMVAIIAMILPGISGGFIFILFGVYEYIIKTINDFTDKIIDFDFKSFDDILYKLIMIVMGIITGLKLFSKILKWLIENHEKKTLSILIGIMIGSLPEIWPLKTYDSMTNNYNLLNSLIFASIGVLIVTLLKIKSKRNNYEKR
mgnify:CR=1 FL=1|tara:strand:+ start:58755 stop:59615 length:861 start_codon:yes stop_codon:yes gene_type:complete